MAKLSSALVALLCASCAPPSTCLRIQISPLFNTNQTMSVGAAVAAWSPARPMCVVADRPDVTIEPATPERIDWIDREFYTPDDSSLVGASTDRRHVWIVVGRIDDSDVYGIAMHELGHVLGLGHYDGPRESWMTEKMGDSVRVGGVTPRDVEALRR